MNYLNNSIEPEGGKTIHLQLAGPFEAWLLNDGYQAKYIKHIPIVRYSKTGQQSLEVNGHGVMNAAAQKRYGVFLKQYLRLGKPMIDVLRGQHPSYLKVAA
jgi:hypothetical protein